MGVLCGKVWLKVGVVSYGCVLKWVFVLLGTIYGVPFLEKGVDNT